MKGRDRYRDATLKYFDEVASIIYSAQTLAILKLKPNAPSTVETVGLFK